MSTAPTWYTYIHIYRHIHIRKIKINFKKISIRGLGYGSVAELMYYTHNTQSLWLHPQHYGGGGILTYYHHAGPSNSQWGIPPHTPVYFWLSPSSMLPPQRNHPCPAYTHLPAMWLWFPSSNPVPSLVASDCFLFQGRGWACPRCTEKNLGWL